MRLSSVIVIDLTALCGNTVIVPSLFPSDSLASFTRCTNGQKTMPRKNSNRKIVAPVAPVVAPVAPVITARATSAYARSSMNVAPVLTAIRPNHAPLATLATTRRTFNGAPGPLTVRATPADLTPADLTNVALIAARFAVNGSGLTPDFFDADIAVYRVDPRHPDPSDPLHLRPITLLDRKIHAARIAARALNGANGTAIPFGGSLAGHANVDAFARSVLSATLNRYPAGTDTASITDLP
jgi:hypothetical protein